MKRKRDSSNNSTSGSKSVWTPLGENLIRAWMEWRNELATGQQKVRPIELARTDHKCVAERCKHQVYGQDVYICLYTGYYHVCNPEQCTALELRAQESILLCSMTGIQYPIQPIVNVDRDTMDFGSKMVTMPRDPTRPGPRPKEVTTSRDSDRLSRTASAVVQKLLAGMAPVEEDEKEKAKKEKMPTKELDKFVDECLQSWNFVTGAKRFPEKKSQYTFERHCLVMVYLAKHTGGFVCPTAFSISHQPWFVDHIVPRYKLIRFGLTSDYTNTVVLFRELLRERVPVSS